MDQLKAEKREKRKVKKKEVDEVKEDMKKFVDDPKRLFIALSSQLDKDQRKQIHKYAVSLNLWPNYKDVGKFIFNKNVVLSLFTTLFILFSDANRILVIEKKDPNKSHLTLSESTIDTLRMESLHCNIQVQNKIKIKPEFKSSSVMLTVPPAVDVMPSRKILPIFEFRNEILTAIDKHQVIVISGQTGTI